MVMRGVQIRTGPVPAPASPTSSIEIGFVGTIGDNSATFPDAGTAFGTFYRVNSVMEAQDRFGAGGTIADAVSAIQDHVSVPMHIAAVQVPSGGLDDPTFRTNIDAAVGNLPTTCTYIGAPELTVNYDSSDNPEATRCTTVAALNTRAGQIDAIAVTDTDWSSVAEAVAYLGVAGNVGTRVLPVAPRIVRADNMPHPASAVAMGAMARNEIDNGIARNPSNIPVFGAVGQEVELLRSRTDATAGVNRILAAGGSAIAWSGTDFRLYGGILGGASATNSTRFVSVRRVVDEAERRLESALSPFEDSNLFGDTIGTLIDVADGELASMRAARLIGSYTVTGNDTYNHQSNLSLGRVGLAVNLGVYTPIGLIDVLLNLTISVPTA